MVRIRRSHRRGRGSIPRLGTCFSIMDLDDMAIWSFLNVDMRHVGLVVRQEYWDIRYCTFSNSTRHMVKKDVRYCQCLRARPYMSRYPKIQEIFFPFCHFTNRYLSYFYLILDPSTKLKPYDSAIRLISCHV